MKYQGEWVTTAVPLRTFQCFQFGAVALLIALGTLHYCAREFIEPGLLQRATRFFDVGSEESVPTAFSILNLFLASLLLYAAHATSKFRAEKHAVYWLLLCLLFFAFAIDEAASIHERSGGLVKYIGLGDIDFPYNKWVILGAIFTATMCVIFVPFLLALPRRTAWMIVLSGGLFVSGALGLEALGGLMLKTGFVSDRGDFIYAIRRIFEEGLEMTGVALFNCTLVSYLAPSTVGVHFTREPS